MIAPPPLRLPGKSIVLGEYAAMVYGAGLVVAHEPYYSFECSASSQEGFLPLREIFHPESPAGRWVQKHSQYFEKFWARFHSPYSQGGFGTSSAEFVAVWKMTSDGNQLNSAKILEDYWSCINASSGSRPSGIDVLAQSQGLGLYEIHREKGRQKMDWPFPHLELCFLPTGVKVQTHEHLATLKNEKFEDLQNLLHQGCESLQTKNEKDFLQSIADYSLVLREYGFVAPTTVERLPEILDLPGVKAAKGCGALGADVILAVVEKDTRVPFEMEYRKKWQTEIFTFPLQRSPE